MAGGKGDTSSVGEKTAGHHTLASAKADRKTGFQGTVHRFAVHRTVHSEDQKFKFGGRGDSIMVEPHENQSLGLQNQYKCQASNLVIIPVTLGREKQKWWEMCS